ncbi:MAG TPA: FGGY-family carbohydrate kinase, partial [Aggregatilineaceae bacterium]|nr:FGGY-family carbohydrate kinase [Aggregatilineaceae bacterium]
AVKVTGPGRMLMIMGTSGVHLVMGERLQTVEGMGGVVRDGIVPGLYGYEAGQTGFGDLFAWFVDHAVPPEYFDAAKKQGIHVHKVLENEAARQKVGEHGLLALDWWNGNRSTLVDADLTGLLIGATLATRAPDIYRALLEAAAFGTRLIIETFERHGITAEELVLGGGLPEKNPLLVQICADVMGRTLQFSGTTQASALGAAIYAAVAAGLYPDVAAAAEKMGKLKPDVVKPSAANKAVYDRLYAEYKSLYDHFGRGQNDVMKRLKSIKLEALTGHHAYLRPS